MQQGSNRSAKADPVGAANATPSRRARTDTDKQRKLQAILDAALVEFSQKGFAEARLDEIARKAGVAKGTIYLYAPSKQALFEAVVRSGISPMLSEVETALLASKLSVEEKLRMTFGFFAREVIHSPRGDLMRLVLREAQNFPEIAAFHHREIVDRGLTILRRLAEQAVASGEFCSDELAHFPHLVFAPCLMALIWTALFQRIAPLDVEGLFEAHLSLLLKAMRPDGNSSAAAPGGGT